MTGITKLQFSPVPAYFCCGYVKSPICDVKDISANFWYMRINNSSSILLKEKDVSKQGCVRKKKEYNYT